MESNELLFCLNDMAAKCSVNDSLEADGTVPYINDTLLYIKCINPTFSNRVKK